jgi:5-methyltetrahydropteroyltriglutamate--homocysteine methyltransferase
LNSERESKGPFRADQVGSLLRPAKLKAARDQHQAGDITSEVLRELEDKLIADVVRKQEGVGLQAITDGDFRRGSWSADFLNGIGGVAMPKASHGDRSAVAVGEVMRDWQPPAPQTVSKLSWPDGGIQHADYEYLAGQTTRTAKVCIPSPSMLHFRGGRGAIDAEIYPDMDEFFSDATGIWRSEIADLAATGCKYVQLDDTNLAYLCDTTMRARAEAMGENLATLPSTYAKLINRSIGGRPADMTATVHLCRGNSVSRGMAEGGYEVVAETIFNEIQVDGFFLEYDSDRAGDFQPLRFVPPGKRVVLGVVTSKFGELEPKDDIKRRIDEAAKFVSLDQLCLSAQCGFASHTTGNVLSEDQQWAKLAMIVELADEIWG